MNENILKSLIENERKIIVLDVIESTNTYLLEGIRNGKFDTGDVVCAKRQSAGKGRRGKSFSSEEGGIYVSFAVNNIEYGLSTVMCGVAVTNALEKLGLKPTIKWVNDILINDRKVCGILAEAVGDGKRAVMGFGINVKQNSIPSELSDIATALDEYIETPISPEELTSDIIKRYEALSTENAEHSSKRIIAEYEAHMNILSKEITVLETGEKFTAIGIAPDGALIAVDKNNKQIKLSSGQISVRKSI